MEVSVLVLLKLSGLKVGGKVFPFPLRNKVGERIGLVYDFKDHCSGKRE